MKKLTGAFKKNDLTKKKSSALTNQKNVKVEVTAPRKINESDYEIIREFAFKNKMSMLEATDHIYKEIERVYSKEKSNLSSVDLEDLKSAEQKSIRLSVEFNDYLKILSNETRIPIKFIISYFVNYLEEKL